MQGSIWRLIGSTLAVLGALFLVGALVTYATNNKDYVAVLTVFGGIFLVIGTGLVLITITEKDKNESPPPPPETR